MSLLDSIKGWMVETTGFAGTIVASALFLRGAVLVAVIALLAIAIAFRSSKRFVSLFSFLQGFADVPEWPEFVTRGLALMIVAYHFGGVAAAVIVGFMLVTADGRMFEALY